MKILVDADALPKPLKEVLLKAAERVKCSCLLVAGRMPFLAPSSYVRGIAAGSDFNGADNWIVANVESGDLVITADIPLADLCVAKGAEVLSIKGDFFTTANIKNAMAMRDLMQELRSTGEITGGPAPFSDKQREKFTNALNRFLQKKR